MQNHIHRYLSVIRGRIIAINGSFETLPFTEWIPLPDEPGHAVKYADLIGHEAEKQPEKFVGELRKGYPVAKLLSGIESPNQTQEAIRSGRYFDFRGANVPGAIFMDDSSKQRITVKSDVANIAAGAGSSVTTGDINIVKNNIDNSLSLDEDTKAKLTQACEKVKTLRFGEDDLRDVVRDLEALQAELAGPAQERPNRRERIKRLLARVKLVAEPVAAVLSTIASVAQLSR